LTQGCDIVSWKSLRMTWQRSIQNRALSVLKQKRLYESQMAQLQQQSFNLEQTSLTTDNLKNTMAQYQVMKQANKELRKQYGKVDIGKIEQMHDEMEDLIELGNEIGESLSRSYGVPEEVDEMDLQAGEQRICSHL
jgi:charged multivesicular body protein 5